MQRMDDVTGAPIRLSARQREQQREMMIGMLNAQTRQINTLTAMVMKLSDDHVKDHDALDRLRAEWDAHDCRHLNTRRTMWHRLLCWCAMLVGR